jgi:superfamily I DNA/RNA helicase
LKGKDNIRNIVPLLKGNINITMGEEWFDKFSNWIMPPLHRIEQGIKLSFNQKQKKYIYPKPQTKQKLAGVAGSGKTLVLAMRAAQLAEKDKKVLVICYNITLKHYIKKQIKKAPVKFKWKNIRINHFHGFTRNYSFKFPDKLPYPFKGTRKENLEQHVKNVIDHRKLNKDYFKYDAILIDEGQDFKEDWYKFLCDFLTENDEVMFAVDEKQNIYNRDLSWVGKGRWGILNQGYRLPKEQIKIINNFSRKFMKLFDDNDETPEILPPDDNQLSLLPMSPKSIWNNIKSFDQVINSVHRSLVYLLNKLAMKESDVVILVDSHKEGLKLKNYIREKMQIYNIMDIFAIKDSFLDRLKKSRFRIDSPCLKMSTIHSFKGWEARNVIIVTPEKKSIDSQLYAALTRVRENLIVFNQNERYEKFGQENFKALN